VKQKNINKSYIMYVVHMKRILMHLDLIRKARA